MKNIFFGLAIIATAFTACNNEATEKKTDNPGATVPAVPKNDSTGAQPVSTGSVAVTAPLSLKEIIDNYLQMKNAFAKDNDKEAATAGNEMVKSLVAFNKKALTPDQEKIYNDIEDDAKEHAEHIGANGGNLKHQREHFDMLSKDIYQLVKTFGAGQKLYYDHCPMYNDGKGAYWISETKEIRNPYFGKSMPSCGAVKEELK